MESSVSNTTKQTQQKDQLLTSNYLGSDVTILNIDRKRHFRTRIKVLALAFIFSGLLLLLYALIFIVLDTDKALARSEQNHQIITANYSLQLLFASLQISMGAVCIFVFQSIMDKCRVKTLNLLSKIEFITSTLLTLAIVVTQQRIKQPDPKIKKELTIDLIVQFTDLLLLYCLIGYSLVISRVLLTDLELDDQKISANKSINKVQNSIIQETD